MIFSTNGNCVITAANTSPMRGADGEADEQLRAASPAGGARRGRNSVKSVAPISLGGGKMYVGMSKTRTANSTPPMTTTATSAMISASPQLLAKLALVSADQLVRLTSPSPSACGLIERGNRFAQLARHVAISYRSR